MGAFTGPVIKKRVGFLKVRPTLLYDYSHFFIFAFRRFYSHSCMRADNSIAFFGILLPTRSM